MKITLRELQRGDLPALNRWRNDPAVIANLGANFLFIGPEVDERWFDAYLAARGQAVRLVIEVDGLAVGVAYLVDIQRINASAEFAIMIGEAAYWSKGVGEASTRQVLAHAFNDLNLHRVHLCVLAENERARRLYAKTGFVEEGLQRLAVFKAGRYRDVVLMALLRERYQP